MLFSFSFFVWIISINSYYINQRNHNILNNTAFCKDFNVYPRYFPVDVPERHIPWVWDAVYDRTLSLVEITAMTRTPCMFNKKIWKEVLNYFPQYSNQLSYGIESNILVPFDENVSVDDELFLLGSKVTCEFLYDGKVVYSVQSLSIRGKRPWTSLGTTQIRCLVPKAHKISWDNIRIRLNSDRASYTTSIFGNITTEFPVCKLPRYSKLQKKYGLSVCTATARSNREYLVEWIEYHLVKGIEHFYIYDTSRHHENGKLQNKLKDYIMEGIVTVIPWHYDNCVRNMASGRMAIYYDKNNTKKFFQPPRAISQSTALASCYSRFKHTSKYIAHIDDDEFLSYSSNEIYNLYKKKPTNLLHLSEIIFSSDVSIVAIKFPPAIMFPCKISDNYEFLNIFQNQTNSIYLPRLGRWDQAEPGYPYEGKMIMKTEAVGMYFVHYVSLLENGIWKRRNEKVIELPFNVTSYYHFKYPYELSYNILEAFLPIENNSFDLHCEYLYRQADYDRIFFPQLEYDEILKIKNQYNNRMLNS